MVFAWMVLIWPSQMVVKTVLRHRDSGERQIFVLASTIFGSRFFYDQYQIWFDELVCRGVGVTVDKVVQLILSPVKKTDAPHLFTRGFCPNRIHNHEAAKANRNGGSASVVAAKHWLIHDHGAFPEEPTWLAAAARVLPPDNLPLLLRFITGIGRLGLDGSLPPSDNRDTRILIRVGLGRADSLSDL